MQERLVSKSGPDRPPVRLTPLPVPKASDVLADDLRERILLGEVPEGTALPTERDLVAQTHMSRATVREALRILEVQGLIRIKTGRAGGAFVQKPTMSRWRTPSPWSSAADASGWVRCSRRARR
jgi:GntR family transcriptional repressor for pyruvate dehydrogenase complex